MGKGKAILAAEARPADAEHLWRCLAPLVETVRLAASAEEVLQLMRRETFNRAVVAAELVFEGEPLLARLSPLPALEHLVAMGLAGDHDMERRARTAGADAYLARPVTTEALAWALGMPVRGPARLPVGGREPRADED